MAADPSDAAIVRSTVDLAHSLNLRVVAEGVEDAPTWDVLAGLACDHAQGYHLARPLPAHALVDWLDARGARSPRATAARRLPGQPGAPLRSV